MSVPVAVVESVAVWTREWETVRHLTWFPLHSSTPVLGSGECYSATRADFTFIILALGHLHLAASPPATQVCDKVKLEKQLTDNVNTRMSVKLNLLHIFSRRRSGILGGKVRFYSFISPLKVSLMYPPCYRCLKSGSKPRHYHQQSPCPGAERAAAALRRPGAEPRGESGMWHFRCGGHRHSWTRRPGAGIPRLEIYPQYSENVKTLC